MLLNMVPCMHRTDPTSVIWTKMSVVLWLRNPDLEETRDWARFLGLHSLFSGRA